MPLYVSKLRQPLQKDFNSEFFRIAQQETVVRVVEEPMHREAVAERMMIRPKWADDDPEADPTSESAPHEEVIVAG